MKLLLSCCVLLLVACSNEDPASTETDHVWQYQVDTLEQARAVSQQAGEAARQTDQQLQQLEQQLHPVESD
jgi:outer membrane biogenesis lipoprotein LolB